MYCIFNTSEDKCYQINPKIALFSDTIPKVSTFCPSPPVARALVSKTVGVEAQKPTAYSTRNCTRNVYTASTDVRSLE